MSISDNKDIQGLEKVGKVVSVILHQMKMNAKPGVSTKELDNLAEQLFKKFGARSAPKLTYDFPGYTCISLNYEAAHGIPSKNKIIRPGDLINIDVSAELDGYFADTGHSFQIPPYTNEITNLCRYTKKVLNRVIAKLRAGMRINEIGKIIEKEVRRKGYHVIKNLCSHGIGRALHEEPKEILPYYNRSDTRRLEEGMVITIEPFLSTRDEFVVEQRDGWTLETPNQSLTAQHEHTMIITKSTPHVVTDLPPIRI